MAVSIVCHYMATSIVCMLVLVEWQGIHPTEDNCLDRVLRWVFRQLFGSLDLKFVLSKPK